MTFDFAIALRIAASQQKTARKTWEPGTYLTVKEDELILWNPQQNIFTVYKPNQEDILAKDWMRYVEEN